MDIIEEEVKEFYLVYEDAHGNVYSFPCDETGNIHWDRDLSPAAAKKSIAVAKARKWRQYREVVTLVRHERYGICPCCGHRVLLGCNGYAPYMGVVQCNCGQWYNVFGQALKPPEDWVEDY